MEEKHLVAEYKIEVHQLRYFKFLGNSVAFDEYLENPTAGDNKHKYSLTFYFEEKMMHF